MKRLQLGVARDEDGQVALKSPGVGLLRCTPEVGQVLVPGQVVGLLSTLGIDQELVVPEGVHGSIVEMLVDAADRAVAFGDSLILLGDSAVEYATGTTTPSAHDAKRNGTLVFCSNSSGRFYLRPAPDKPAFVSEGDEIEEGQTVFLLEVMKTFSRVSYGGEGLPARARILRIVPVDGDDLEAGQVVLELEAA